MADYWINNTDGDDNNDGLSIGGAVRSTQRFRDLIAGLASGGDTINFIGTGKPYYIDNSFLSIGDEFGSGDSERSRLIVQGHLGAVINQGLLIGGTPYTTGLLAAWYFNDANFQDVSGNGNDLTQFSSSTPVIGDESTAWFGGAQARFSADVTERLTVAGFRPLSGRKNFTIYLKISVDADATTGTICAQYAGNGQRAWRLRLMSDGRLRFYYTNDGSTEGNVLLSGGDNRGKTVKLTIVVSNGVCRLYRSGAVFTDGGAQTIGTIFNTTTDLTVGGHSAGEPFKGTIDYLAFFDHAHSPHEIREVSANGHNANFGQWEPHDTNLWKARVLVENAANGTPHSPTRLYVDGVDVYKPGEYGVTGTGDLATQWAHWLDEDNDTLYVYSTTDPSNNEVYITSGNSILTGTVGNPCDHLTVRDIEIKHSVVNGFIATYGDDIVFHNVKANHNNYGGISASTGCARFRIEYSTLARNDHAGGFSNDAGNVVTLKANHFEGNWRQSWAIESGSALIVGNRMLDVRRDLTSDFARHVQIGGTDVTLVEIYNNYLGSTEKSCLEVLTFTHENAELICKNNLFDGQQVNTGVSFGNVIIGSDGVGKATLDNNVYSSVDPSATAVKWDGTDYATVELFAAAVGGQEANGFSADPMLDANSVAGADSDLIGAGVKWWTGPRPDTVGDPLPDIQIDIGLQSTHGSLHPSNL